MSRFLLLLTLLSTTLFANAQKSVYIPNQTLKAEGYDPSTTVNNLSVPWCRYRSRESNNIIVFWHSGYGNNDPNSAAVPAEYRVDIDDMLAKLESFYDLNVNRLGFADLSHSNLSKYKMVICLYYTTDWMAYGGGFDDVIGGMWVSPSTCHPVGQTIAHEIGHSFQYQCFCDLRGYAGFRYSTGNGSAWWEGTANWQSAMAYPDLMYSMSMDLYRRAHNTAMTHEWMRYQSYWMYFWWCDRHGLDMVGRLWRGSTHDGYDINEVYMDLMGLDAKGLYKEYMDANMHFVTWDFNNEDWKRRGSYFDIGNFMYNYVQLGMGEFQVAYSSCPQATGYNVIPLDVPAAGTTISTHFTALRPGASLADGDPRQFWNGAAFQYIDTNNYNSFAGSEARGFRLGYVALLNNGSRVYQTEDKVYCTGTDETSVDVSFTVPANTSRLWLVVSPAPTRYFRHLWDENISNDDQWPYRVKFTGTNIPGASKFYLYDAVSDRFVSRGGTGGTQAVADEYGLPLVINSSSTKVTLQMLDNQRAYLGGSSILSTTSSSAMNFTAEENEQGTAYKNTSGQYMSISSNGSIAMSSVPTYWKIVTSAERNAIIAQRLAEREKATGALANISVGAISLAEHAQNDFVATDMTSRVRNAALGTNTTGWTVKGTAPGAEANVLEVYQGTGTELSQTLTDLPKGLYRVSLHAFYRDGWPGDCVNYNNAGFSNLSNAWLKTNDDKVQIADWAGQRSGDAYPNYRSEARVIFNEGRYRNDVYTFVGDEGTLTISFGSPQYLEAGWFCFANVTLTYYGMNDEMQEEYIEVVPDTPDDPQRVISPATYYIRNRLTGNYLAAGNAFGTQASVIPEGLNISLKYQQNGQYTFNTQVSNGTNLNFMSKPEAVGGVIYMDGAAFNYAITPADEGYYTISYCGVSENGTQKRFYLGVQESLGTALSTRLTDPNDEAAQWQFLTRAQLVSLLTEEAKNATELNPMDVTVLMYGAGFNRNDQRNTTSWKGSPTIGGDIYNPSAEKFNTSFDVYQSLSGLPAGTYKMTAQGFYRHGLPEPAYTAFRNNTVSGGAMMYANTESVELLSIFSEARKSGFPANNGGAWTTPSTAYTVPDDMLAACTAFSAGFYNNELLFKVGTDGKLRMGFKKTTATPDAHWTIFDNIHLYILSLDEATGISNIEEEGEGQMSDTRIYDLTGRCVADGSDAVLSLPKGIYIQQGKKFLIR